MLTPSLIDGSGNSDMTTCYLHMLVHYGHFLLPAAPYALQRQYALLKSL